jgi:hypothetical protein
MTFLRALPLSNEKAFVCYSFPGSAPFLAVSHRAPFVAHVEPLLTQYRVTFICERRDDARQRLSVLFKAGGSHVSVGTNKFSINRRRRATIAPISLSRRRDGAYRVPVVEITLKYAMYVTESRLSNR